MTSEGEKMLNKVLVAVLEITVNFRLFIARDWVKLLLIRQNLQSR